jgi:hypothetical protein
MEPNTGNVRHLGLGGPPVNALDDAIFHVGNLQKGHETQKKQTKKKKKNNLYN